MRILFIGNSYTYYNDMPMLFSALAEENGEEVSVESVTAGGRRLIENSSADETAHRVEEAIREGGFDVMILQEQSVLPITDYDIFLEGVSNLCKLAGDKMQIILYETWARAEGCPKLDELSLTREEMLAGLRSAYTRAAESVGAAVSPVGDAFALFGTRSDLALYDPDLSHPSYLGSSLAAAVHFHTAFGRSADSCHSFGLETSAEKLVLSVAREKLEVES